MKERDLTASYVPDRVGFSRSVQRVHTTATSGTRRTDPRSKSVTTGKRWYVNTRPVGRTRSTVQEQVTGIGDRTRSGSGRPDVPRGSNTKFPTTNSEFRRVGQ